MGSRKFYIVTKQSIEIELIPLNVYLTQRSGFVDLELDDIDNFRYVLYLFLSNNSIEGT